LAALDRDRDEVVVRIVYDGPPTAGKTTSLRALADRFGGRPVTTPEEAGGRTLYFDWMEYTGGRFEGRPIRCQIVSVPGQLELAPRRRLLVASADAVIFVADTSPAAYAESLAHLSDLLGLLDGSPAPRPGVVLQANKRDLPGAARLDELRSKCGLALIESIASTGEGVREAFVFAVRLALDRVRELMQAGALADSTPEQDPAAALLADLRALPLGAESGPLWPQAAPVEAGLDGSPRAPDTTIPSGWIWPPIGGRILLQEATAGTVDAARELSPHEWLAQSTSGWRFYSSAACAFADLEAARTALLRWAQLHVALGELVSPARCVALCEAGDGTYRIWQVVRTEPCLWQTLCEALRTRDPQRIGGRIAELALVSTSAAARWAEAPCELPCTLETVGAGEDGPRFVSLVPNPQAARAPAALDRRARLLRQIELLVRSRLGDGARFVAGALREAWEAAPVPGAARGSS
jgi:hypothetical protein